MTPGKPLRTPAEVVRLSPRERVRFAAIAGWHVLTGRWRHPAPTNGDFEAMTELDKVYWIHKAKHPVTRAEKGAGLEDHFARASRHRWSVPEGFVVSRHATLSAAGDLLDHPWLGRSGGWLYERVAETVFGADLAMANLECVVDPGAAGALVIRLNATAPLALSRSHFDAVKGHEGRCFGFFATANNHSLDFGRDGVSSTRAALSANRIATHGMNESFEESERASLLDVAGVSVAVVSWTFGLNGKRPPDDRPWIVNRAPLNDSPRDVTLAGLETQLAWSRSVGADFVVAQLHWGLEHELFPRRVQVEMAHHLAELGVDLVVGHHPHVVQPMEAYRTRRDRARVVPIYYSLGNLVNPFTHPLYRRGAVARVRLAKGTDANGIARTYVSEATMHHVEQRLERGDRLRIVELESVR